MSLLEKARNVLFTDFLEKNLEEEYQKYKKAYTNISLLELLNIRDRERMNSFLYPIYTENKILFSTLGKTQEEAVARKVRQIIRFLPVEDVFVFEIDIIKKKFYILYHPDNKGRKPSTKRSPVRKSLVMNGLLLREIKRSNSHLSRHFKLLQNSFALFIDRKLESYYFQKINYSNKPRLLLVYKPKFYLYKYENVEKLMENFFSKIFYKDISAASRKVSGGKDAEAENFELDQETQSFLAKLFQPIKNTISEKESSKLLKSLSIKGLVFLERAADEVAEPIYFVASSYGVKEASVNSDLFIHGDQLSVLNTENRLSEYIFNDYEEFHACRVYIYEVNMNRKMVIVFTDDFVFKETSKSVVKMKLICESLSHLYA